MTTRGQLRALAHYCRTVADILELRDWTIVVKTEQPPHEDALATCEPIYGKRTALLRFSDEFWTLDPVAQRHTVVHELVHVHLDAADTVVNASLPELLGRPAFHAFEQAWRASVEQAVDTLAYPLARLIVTPVLDPGVDDGRIADTDQGGDLRMEPWRPDARQP